MRRSGEAASASTDRWIAEGSDIEPASERGRIGLQAEPQTLRRCEAEIAERPVRQLARAAELRALLQRELDRLNATLSRFATVKRFTILPREFLESKRRSAWVPQAAPAWVPHAPGPIVAPVLIEGPMGRAPACHQSSWIYRRVGFADGPTDRQ